jgi:hypothetical protein
VVPFSDYRPGNIVIVTHARQLYFVLGQGRTIRYPVGVGRAGMAWHGRARIARKDLHPAWSPPTVSGGAIHISLRLFPAARRIIRWVLPPWVSTAATTLSTARTIRLRSAASFRTVYPDV